MKTSSEKYNVPLNFGLPRLKEILLPEQLRSLREFGSMSWAGVWPFVTTDEVKEFLEISPAQSAAIEKQCNESAKSIEEALATIEKITIRERQKVKRILKTLSKKQREDLEKIIGTQDIERFFDALDLTGLRSHVRLLEK